jgi:Spy/CpxP family protein refolding chaperone
MKLPAESLAIENHRIARKERTQAATPPGDLLFMRTFFTVGLTGTLALWMTAIALAQENAPQPHRPNPSRPSIHGPRSIDQELDHLTKDLELTANQRKQIRPLLQEHHDRIQALFDKNPRLSRETLGPQIHAISDETHRQIEALLTEHQKELAKAMQERMYDGEESRPRDE